jgi:hypothetical protein
MRQTKEKGYFAQATLPLDNNDRDTRLSFLFLLSSNQMLPEIMML